MIKIDDNEVEVSPLPENFPAGGGEQWPGRDTEPANPLATPPPADAFPAPIDPPTVMRGGNPSSLGVVLSAEIAGTGCGMAAARSWNGPDNPSESEAGEDGLSFYRAAHIAAFLDVSKKTVHRRAVAEAWPSRGQGNWIEYSTPFEMPASAATTAAAVSQVAVTLPGLGTNSDARAKALRREEAVLHYTALLERHGVERALALTVVEFAGRPVPFLFAAHTLRTWRDLYAQFGINGLVDQKQGVVGRKPYARHLDKTTRHRLQAKSHEHGSVARGVRELMRDPGLHYGLRETMHEGHASKSHVARSIRAAAVIAPTTTDLLQGPGKARLDGRFTPCSYEDVKAGEYFCGDDMTSNIYAWREHPNKLGYIIGQPQILPIIDVGSLRWLNVRVVMNAIEKADGTTRSHSSYTADDVWGLYGDVFDSFGLPRVGFVSEFGSWQAERVIGQRSGLSTEERVGGLSSLGLKLVPSFDPRTKIIETCFNQLQHQLDAMPGFAGRDQRKHMPETIKRLLAECRSGKRHPRTCFPHVSQLSDAVQLAMENLNNERRDGIILHGRSPLEKWAEDKAEPNKIPDGARWMYRSATSKTEITRNGVRVTIGSGKKLVVHYYDNPAVFEEHHGRPVRVFWNDHNPEADAIILYASVTNPGKFVFLCSAKYVPPLKRFGASDAQLAAEARRKGAAMDYARTELRAIQPELQRNSPVIPADCAALGIGERIADATAAVEAEESRKAEKRRVEKQISNRVAKTEVNWDDLGEPAQPARPAKREYVLKSAPLSRDPRPTSTGGITDQELAEL